MSFFKNKSGVSHLFGYMLTLSLTAVIIAVTILTTNSLIDEKARDAAEIYAENIVNKISNSIINMCNMKQQYPSANYSTEIEIPWKLVDRFRYYIEIGQNDVYVKTYDGIVTKHSTLFNTTIKNAISISMPGTGKVDSTNGLVNISVKSYDYSHKFDFGNNSSELTDGYTKITDYMDNSDWHYNEWKYRSEILISNPVEELYDYQILVQLNDTNFNYALAGSNGSDLRFRDESGNLLDYWIERWYPRDTHTSRIWVNIPTLKYKEYKILVYYGNPDATPMSNGDHTFDFFDNFNMPENSLNSDKWTKYECSEDDVTIEDGFLVLRNGSAIRSKTQVGLDPCIIETKAKTTGDIREASMYARNKVEVSPPYSSAVIFNSGNFSSPNDKFLSVYKNNATALTSLESPVSQGWNRLTYIINDTTDGGRDTVVCRYYYENFTIDGQKATADIENTYKFDGNFGLCTTEAKTTGYYDWIFVRKFRANTDLAVITKLNQYTPVAYVNVTESRDFWWDNRLNLATKDYSGQGMDYDFICNNGANSVQFSIQDLDDIVGPNKQVSLVFTVGDPEREIRNMKITVDGSTSDSETFNCYKTTKKIKIDVTSPAAGNNLVITFDDVDDDVGEPVDFYWAVGDLTIQRGERTIDVKSG